MKTFDFNQTGGFKLVTEVLAGLQDGYSIFSGVAKMAGDKAIVSGCEDLGTNISDGIVIINGETLEFKGGVKQATVIIKEEKTQAAFEDGSVKDFETYRYAAFGFSVTAYNWADFKRVTPLNLIEERLSRLEKLAKPILEGNSPILFLKPASEIPPGYSEWLGAAGLTLVGRNEADSEFSTLGTVGGSKTATIQKKHLPNIKIGTGIYTNGGQLVDDSGPADNIGTAANGTQILTETLGLSEPLKILSPHRIVNYIIYTG
ncbi:hypothetical protein EGY05_13510 [Chryseobacterium arthrosphaerae]|uniref:hypothetical protein n=1 Tax=Chryseobacterium arthrosphaerae TaxID=651561 RepID=UPI000F4F65A6|nr:hypothetical protein [Chryseobacterium arthrosphaerae]AYZ12878.1 hypothetical protein EGY05_13510 [Chryseobacterium arthrosphaerae]